MTLTANKTYFDGAPPVKKITVVFAEDDNTRAQPTIVAAHAAESRLVHAQDATITATMLQNLGSVLTALHPTKDAVIRAGALLIVKVDWIVAIHQLTPAQQLQLDHQPQLVQPPHNILSAFGT